MKLLSRLPVFAQKTLGSFLLRFGALGLQFLGSILIARQLGVAGFGAYGYAFTWATLIGVALGLGMGQLAIREVPRYLANAEHGALRGFVAIWVLGLLVSGMLAAAILAVAQALGWLSFAVSWPLVFLVALTHAAVLGLSALLSGFQRILQSQFLESILRQVLFLAVVLACILLGLKLDAEIMFQLTLLAVLPVIAAMAWLLRRSMAAAIPTPPPPRSYTVFSWLAASLPLLMTTMTMTMQTSLDMLMLGAMADDTSLGLFRAASRGAELPMIAQGLTLQVLGPMLARALAQDDRLAAQNMISQSAVMACGLGLAICMALALFPGTYLGLFGAEFRAATPVLWVLVATQAIAVVLGPAALILVMLHHEKFVLQVTLVALALNFGLKLLMIPAWQAMGAAVSTLIAVAVLKIVMLAKVVQAGGFDPTLWAPLKQGLARLRNRA